MDVHAHIMLSKDVEDLDKADDWFYEIRILLTGQTDCVMDAQSSNHEERIVITKEN